MQFNNWRIWIGLAVSGLFLLLLLLRVDRQEIVSALSNANYLYVAPAIGLYFIAVYFRSIRWAYLLSPIGPFPVNRLYPVVIIGYMANNLLPARLGELVRSYYLAQRETVSGSTALATVAVERVYDHMRKNLSHDTGDREDVASLFRPHTVTPYSPELGWVLYVGEAGSPSSSALLTGTFRAIGLKAEQFTTAKNKFRAGSVEADGETYYYNGNDILGRVPPRLPVCILFRTLDQVEDTKYDLDCDK